MLAASSVGWAGEAKAFGKPLKGLKPTPLADILAKPENGRAVRLEGQIAKVCREKGCWMELRQGEGATMHVTFEDYAFFVPKDSAGSDAVLEGKVVVKAPDPEDDVKHLKGEGAGTWPPHACRSRPPAWSCGRAASP